MKIQQVTVFNQLDACRTTEELNQAISRMMVSTTLGGRKFSIEGSKDTVSMKALITYLKNREAGTSSLQFTSKVWESLKALHEKGEAKLNANLGTKILSAMRRAFKHEDRGKMIERELQNKQEMEANEIYNKINDDPSQVKNISKLFENNTGLLKAYISVLEKGYDFSERTELETALFHLPVNHPELLEAIKKELKSRGQADTYVDEVFSIENINRIAEQRHAETVQTDTRSGEIDLDMLKGSDSTELLREEVNVKQSEPTPLSPAEEKNLLEQLEKEAQENRARFRELDTKRSASSEPPLE